tara:strand:- start:28 stop:387 length:360 start_codon:yes stop_codon:yes gene_type:complete
MSDEQEPKDILKEAEDVAERRDAEHDMTEKAEGRPDWSFFQTDWDELAFWIQTERLDAGITKHGTKRLMAVFQEAYDNQGRDAQFTLAGMVRVISLMKTLMDKKFGESDYDEVSDKEGS